MTVSVAVPTWAILAVFGSATLLCAVILYFVTRMLVYRLGTEVQTLAAQLVIALNGTAPRSARECLSPRSPSSPTAPAGRGRHAGDSSSAPSAPDRHTDGESFVQRVVPACRVPEHPPAGSISVHRQRRPTSAAELVSHAARTAPVKPGCLDAPGVADLARRTVSGSAQIIAVPTADGAP
ncbi:hypothetical protein F0L68_35565 [Solihabitans fulvus]|uniref:Uncharacterized protein n=1 Tax=Solihabitans fulvus TaxID=1892852 RepID=A0A5B2WNV3_9PSEU|nr:hypothetical protein [Solihabitans fulvus]KAA2252372.1 hypothetical protein F0L68_35565 [Solihabitans fulvus]